TVINRKEIEKYSHVATLDEIKENDYNLNIPRYVDTFEEEEAIDLVALGNEMVALNADIKKAETDFLGLLDELAVTADTKEIIEATKAVFR
ncbi:N-6 DNA methylase, partial [Listeria monocytogenes]|nr:N-6 DNA methylase [Listeria monocytogenes]